MAIRKYSNCFFMKKNLVFRKSTEYITFIFFYIILQVIQYAYIFHEFIPTYFFCDLLLIAALACPIFFFKSSLFDYIYFDSIMLLFAVLVGANCMFYHNFGTIFSLLNLSFFNHGAAIAGDPSYYDFALLSLIVLVYGLFVASLFFINKVLFKFDQPSDFRRNKVNTKGHPFLTLGLIACLLGSYTLSMYSINDDGFGSSVEDIVTISKNDNFSRYGMMSYYIKELDYILNGAPKPDEQKMIDYFKRKVDYQNSFTGLLEGKNVFVIMIETGDDLMINEYLTPNMYALTQESLYCENTLSKNKTNISEFIGLTGSAPTAGVLASRYDYNLPYSLVSQLNNIDYHTMYFHDTSAEPEHNMDLYGREVLMPKLGFDNSYFHEDLFGEDYPMWDWTGNYTFDSITMPIVTDTILQSDEPFFAFYTSLSMHGPYANRANQKTLEEMYGEKLEYAKENNLWRNPLEIYAPIDAPCVDTYMMCAMDFDKALGEMFERFEQEGKLDDTLFVIYGDHDMYYPGYSGRCLNQLISRHDKEDKYYSDIYTTTLFFKNDDLLNYYVDKYHTNVYSRLTSPYNVVPTILDLLGINYNPNFYIGNSLFSKQMEDVQVFFSIELSAFFDKYYWSFAEDEISRVFISYGEKIEDFLDAVSEIAKKQSYLDTILTTDYFSTYNYEDFMP